MSDCNGAAASSHVRRPAFGVAARVLIETALAGHLVVAAFYWWLSPKGFPVHHSRFWLNSVVPLAVVAATLVGLAGVLQQRRRTAGLVVACFASAWFAAAISGRVFFPFSLRGFWAIGLVAALLAAGWSVLLLRKEQGPTKASIPCTVLSALVGFFVVWAQIPPTPATQPLGEFKPARPERHNQQVSASVLEIGDDHRFYPGIAEVAMKRGDVKIRCSPLLGFDRVSRDGFWSILAPESPRSRSLQRHTHIHGLHVFHYHDGATIELPEPTADGSIEVTAQTPVERDTFSHLNSFCVLDVVGHKKLSLTFSPCQEALIDVLPADYPTGRPARFAYLDDSDTFSVVEATSGEKGPFRLLASGPLRRGETLRISLHDDGQLVASIVLQDWAQQLSTTLSPTAGWGVPANAIEFQRLDTNEDAPAAIWITLAATSVGRGWETVGHRAGTYRNRVLFRVEPLR